MCLAATLSAFSHKGIILSICCSIDEFLLYFLKVILNVIGYYQENATFTNWYLCRGYGAWPAATSQSNRKWSTLYTVINEFPTVMKIQCNTVAIKFHDFLIIKICCIVYKLVFSEASFVIKRVKIMLVNVFLVCTITY